MTDSLLRPANEPRRSNCRAVVVGLFVAIIQGCGSTAASEPTTVVAPPESPTHSANSSDNVYVDDDTLRVRGTVSFGQVAAVLRAEFQQGLHAIALEDEPLLVPLVAPLWNEATPIETEFSVNLSIIVEADGFVVSAAGGNLIPGCQIGPHSGRLPPTERPFVPVAREIPALLDCLLEVTPHLGQEPITVSGLATVGWDRVAEVVQAISLEPALPTVHLAATGPCRSNVGPQCTPAPPRATTLQQGPAFVVIGSPTPAGDGQVSRLFASRTSAFRRCYEASLTQSPGLTAELTIQFTIANAGNVRDVTSASMTTSNTPLQSCV